VVRRENSKFQIPNSNSQIPNSTFHFQLSTFTYTIHTHDNPHPTHNHRHQHRTNRSLSLSLLSIVLALTVAPTTTSAATLTAPPNNLGLVGYWSFEDSRGSQATDFSGFGNDGTLTNMNPATDWVAGRLGTALEFDGSDDYLDVPEPNVGSSPTLFSISGWIKPESGGQSFFITPQSNGRDQLLSHDRGNEDFSICVAASANTNGRCYITADNSMPYGKWSHFTAVVDEADDTIQLYINGQLKKDVTDSDPIADWSNRWIIGQRGNGSYYFNGTLDDVRVYDRALTEANVQDLYQSGFTKVNTSRKLDNINGLQGWWTMDGKDIDWSASSGQIKDSSGFSNDGTTNGGMTNDSAAQGRVGQALSFDGTDDRINVGDISAMEGGGDYSFAGWFNIRDDTSDNDLIVKGNHSGSSEYLLWQDVGGSANNFQAILNDDDGDGNRIVRTKGINLGQWYHVATVVDPSSDHRMYLNGDLQDTNTMGSADGIGQSGDPYRIGADTNQDRPLAGKADDVRFYDQALTANEIQRLYNATRPSPINTSRTDRLTDGLVGFWSMNGQDVDLSNSTAEIKDVSGNGNDGDAKNGASPAIGKLGQGFGFDGEDDYIRVPDSSLWDFAGKSRTVSVWFQANENQPTSYQRFFDHFDGGYPGAGWFFGFDSQSDNVFFSHRDDDSGSDIKLRSPNTYNDGIWHHAVTTLEGGTARLYIDGTEVDTDSYSSLNDRNERLKIGSDGDGGNEFKGSLDNARIYSRALSGGEVKQLYRLGE